MRSIVLSIVTCAVLFSGCAQLPDLQEATGGIPVRDIVLRIKCELSDAFEAADRRNWLPSNPKFAWLRNWTAQVDLTLQVLDTATLAPGATFTTPLRNPAESFAIAAGASLNGQAQRIETMSFSISLLELELWRRQSRTAESCSISDNLDLKGRLGLKEWVLEALSPVARETDDAPEYLFAGNHPKPGSTAVSIPKVANVEEVKSAAAPALIELPCDKDNYDKHLQNAENNLVSAAEILGTANTKLKGAQSTLQGAKSTLQKFDDAKSTFVQYLKDSKNFDAVTNPDIKRAQHDLSYLFDRGQPVEEKISTVFKETQTAIDNFTPGESRAQKSIDLATRYVTIADRKVPETGCIADTKSTEALKFSQDTLVLAETAVANASSANKSVNSFKPFMTAIEGYIGGLKTIDPPITTIGQSVQFILAYGGNFTPTWTFVRFKGPNSPLFSSAGTRTHILNITLGPVQPGTSNTPVAAVTTNQLYLLLNNVLPPLAR
jgi:hypothetical protein